jgi:site-specific recombinase XerD
VRHLLRGIREPLHKSCLAVMYACGLRISEATTLEVGSMDRTNRALPIAGKGNEERLAAARACSRRPQAVCGVPIATGAG